MQVPELGAADRVCTFLKYCDSSRLAQPEAGTSFDETVFRKDAAANYRQRQPVRGLLDPVPSLSFVLGCIYDVVLIRNSQNLLAVEPHPNKRLILLRKPEPINFLILPHEVGRLDPEGRPSGRMTLDPDHVVVVNVNPQLAFKQILVLPP